MKGDIPFKIPFRIPNRMGRVPIGFSNLGYGSIAQGLSPHCAGSVPPNAGGLSFPFPIPHSPFPKCWGLSPVRNVGKNGVGVPVL